MVELSGEFLLSSVGGINTLAQYRVEVCLIFLKFIAVNDFPIYTKQEMAAVCLIEEIDMIYEHHVKVFMECKR